MKIYNSGRSRQQCLDELSRQSSGVYLTDGLEGTFQRSCIRISVYANRAWLSRLTQRHAAWVPHGCRMPKQSDSGSLPTSTGPTGFSPRATIANGQAFGVLPSSNVHMPWRNLPSSGHPQTTPIRITTSISCRILQRVTSTIPLYADLAQNSPAQRKHRACGTPNSACSSGLNRTTQVS